MQCVICKIGHTERGTTTMTLERGEGLVVVRAVPAQVCNNCGEAYVDEATSEQLLAEAAAVLRAGARVDVREYRAA